MLAQTIVLATSLALAAGPSALAASRAPAKVERPPAAASNPQKLRPGAKGPACLECHGDFEQRLKKGFVHTPVRAGECTGCHDPHASDHAKLLTASQESVCLTCHAQVAPSPARSTHKPVDEKRCTACHDPHAGVARSNLLEEGNDLCASCHKAIAEAAAGARHKHHPVQKGCTACHDPHGSAGAADLLKKDVPELCLGCHRVETPLLAKKHLGYPVKTARCTTCHDPHGSNVQGMLLAQVHPPVAKAQCAMCHEAATSRTPFKTKQAGAELCRTCHSHKMDLMLGRNRVHQPVAEGACLACHGPHASKARGLLKGDALATCGSCHADTIRRQAVSVTKHKPIGEGECYRCHEPHGGNGPLFFTNPDGIELCGQCHDWQQHASHPLGEKVKDPRNPSLFLQCSSCHRAHGTEYKHMLPFPTATALCTNCHERFKR